MSEQNTLMTEAATITDAAASQEAAPQETATAAPVVEAAPAEAQGKQAGAEGEPKKAAPEVPEQYEDFKFEEGKNLPEGVGDQLKADAKDLGLTQAQAQKLAERELKRIEAAEAKQAETLDTFRSQWADDARADQEFGGEHLDANLATARKALDTFGTPELKGLLNVSGMGNHPEVIRFMYRAGKAISDDGIVKGAPPAATRDPKRLYPNSNMNP